MLDFIRSAKTAFVVSLSSVALGACSYTGSSDTGRGSGYSDSGATAKYIIGKPYKVAGRWYTPRENLAYSRVGRASWYGPGFDGRKTASGEKYDQYAMTAAHPTLPMPTFVRVTNTENGRSVVVKINDRGPFKDGRIIDLSKAAAEKLRIVGSGTARVRVTVVRDKTIEAKQRALAATETASGDEMSTFELKKARAERYERSEGSTSARRERRSREGRIRPRRQRPEGLGSADSRAARLNRIGTAAGPGSVGRPTDLRRSEDRAAGRYWIQVGSFTRRANATTASADLRDVAEPEVAALRVHGTRYYRVRVGPFMTRTEARRALARIRSMDYPDAKILVK